VKPPFPADLPELIFRLVLALLLASAFGWERERKNRAAGLRTHMLVCVGAALITMVSESYSQPGGPWKDADPTRITAQIVSGIGFIGAGTILVRGNVVRGLTTAATLWVAAGLGIAVGRGGVFYWLAGAASLIVLFILTVVDWLEDKYLHKTSRRELTVYYSVDAGSDSEIAAILRGLRIEVRSIERLSESDQGVRRTLYEVWLLPENRGAAEERLLRESWVSRLEWDF
jgi:uncharacterized membrane protein YhiD involved in acid resistance